MQKPKYCRRLPLQGTQNTRDLGGYACEGGTTRYGMFVRSDTPSALTEADIEYLRAYGITDSVDLRLANEADRVPSSLREAPGFVYHLQPIYGKVKLSFDEYDGSVPGSLEGLYTHFLKNCSDQIVNILRDMLTAEGGVLYHCMVGKDRTGIISMILLKLAGVADEDVTVDYAMTELYKEKIYEEQKRVFQTDNIPESMMHSRPVTMKLVLKYVRETYGDIANFLLQAGLTQQEIDTLRSRLVDAG